MEKEGKIVWVYGSSAAGKDTFVRSVSRNAPEHLVSDMGWLDQPIVMCVESVDWIAQFSGDPLGDKRKELLEVVPVLAERNPGAVILIKGQDLDLMHDRLRKLRQALPEHEHSIIFLQADLDEIYRRLVESKPWFDKDLPKEVPREWIGSQIAYLQALADEFEIVTLDSNPHSQYKKLPSGSWKKY